MLVSKCCCPFVDFFCCCALIPLSLSSLVFLVVVGPGVGVVPCRKEEQEASMWRFQRTLLTCAAVTQQQHMAAMRQASSSSSSSGVGAMTFGGVSLVSPRTSSLSLSSSSPAQPSFLSMQQRFASAKYKELLPRLRNIGISAHIDSGKTTLTERILFYTGKINRIHEVKGSGDVGATMDSMELEKERGITIRSAATFCKWKDTQINIIDTPGHVDFTIEVERALRVLDGAVLLMCGVGGVQSQTLTVDRQMRRYGVPRICFINKLDRDNANPQRALKMAQDKLGINAAFIQINIGTAQDFEGIVDVIERCAYFYEGKFGEKTRTEPVPDHMKDELEAARKDLIARLAEHDEAMEELFLGEEDPTAEQLHAAVRRTTIANKFIPVMVGSAYKNKGVQQLLDAVERYLPNPGERVNTAFTVKRVTDEDGNKTSVKDKKITLESDDEKPFVGIVFKLEETKKTGFSNYVRVYQGKLKKEQLIDIRTGKTFTPGKIVRMHADSTEVVDTLNAGEIGAITGDFGAASGDTVMRAQGGQQGGSAITCEDMYVPPRVISASIKIKNDRDASRARARLESFMREDPTFNYFTNSETKEEIVEGMGELHLDIYLERIRREDDIAIEMGKPTVNYREVITKPFEFDYIFKRQSGGAGQWAHVRGTISPLPIDMSTEKGTKNKAMSKCPNGEVREALQKSFLKQFDRVIFKSGTMIKAPVWGIHVHLAGGSIHEVDSNDISFRNCAQELWESNLRKMEPTLVEPFMDVEITCPANNMSDVSAEFSKRDGVVSDTVIEGQDAVIRGETALDTMFGFISDLRKLTKGQGGFAMQFKEYRPMSQHKAQAVIDERNKQLQRKTYNLNADE